MLGGSLQIRGGDVKRALFFTLIIALSGCSVKIVPQPVESGIIHPDHSQTITKKGFSVTARVENPDLGTYNLAEKVTPVYLAIENRTDREALFSMDSFLLVDGDGRQHSALPPEKIKEIVARDTYYLLPYPYVGFYYLEDYEKESFYNQFNSQLPYFYEVYPQDITTKALPITTIIPGSNISGLLYFNTDVRHSKSIKILVYPPGSSKSQQPDFVFPFAIK